jgi:hypothetical protein
MAKNKESKEALSPDIKETPKFDVAIVEVDGKEARKYSLKTHGSDFAKLAEEFASHTKGAEVKMLRLEKGVTCPACGHEFHP